MVGLDLDVCVPQWMRDNFAKGQYPTLAERQAFATTACDYVEASLAEVAKEGEDPTTTNLLGTIVSFSFVNTDLRDIFRRRFPAAQWYLMDTSEAEAAERIRQRQGHFYKGKVQGETTTDTQQQQQEKEEAAPSKSESDNKDWNFAPVTFDHVVLDGTKSVAENADIVAMGLSKLLLAKQSNIT